MAREMKDSGIDWIREIPILWQCVKLGFLYSFSSGDTLTAQDFVDDGIYDVYGANGKRGKYDNYNVQGKHILIGRVGALCGNIHLVNDDIWVTEHALVSNKLSEMVTDEYAAWLLNSMKLGQYASGTAQPVIAAENIRKLRIPLPSIEEQHLIATYLDDECARIDSVIDQTRASIEEYKKLKQAVITQAVTKGIRPDRQMKDSGVDWLGLVPVDWPVQRIANLYDERNESGSAELPILTVSINTGISDHEIDDDEKQRVFVRSEDKSKYKRVYPGDLAYNMMRAWQGAFGAVRTDGMISPAYVVARPKGNSQLDSRYMEALLRTPSAIEEMHRYSHGITDFRLRLYWPEFKNICVCVPPIYEQREIADYIDEKSEQINSLVAKKEDLLSSLESYKKSLIYEYVTGKKEVPA